MNPQTIKQIYIRKWGGPATLSVEESPLAENYFHLTGDEVIVDVHYSGINFADIFMRLGFYGDAPPRPFVPGYEISGTVLKVGPQVKNLKVGDEVYGGSYFGGYASLVKLSSWQLFPVPSHLSMSESAALPVALITAHQTLFEMARVRKGDKVLIDCGTGGVGTLALQMLKHAGAITYALTGTPSKKPLIESYGAIALTHQELEAQKNLNDFHVVLNSQGGTSVMGHYKRLRPGGRIICIGMQSGIKDGKRAFLPIIKAVLSTPKFSVLKLFNHNKGVFGLNALRLMREPIFAENLAQDFAQVETLKLRPHVGKIFPAAAVGEAHHHLESRQGEGKILLQWKD